MNVLQIYHDAEWALEHNKITLGEFDEQIKPLTDVETVVRCKDCKYHGSENCPLFTDAVEFVTDDDWFCADGEKEDDRDG